MKSLTLVGKRWFRRSYGSTYHTVQIVVDGELIHVSGRQYGYESAYEQTALEWLQANGYLMDAKYPLSRYCRDNGIAFESIVCNVEREKDL